MEEKNEGRNGQVVNLSQVFAVAKWRKVLSDLLMWENWKAELPQFNSCNYGLSYKWDTFLLCLWIKHQSFPKWEKWFLSDVT